MSKRLLNSREVAKIIGVSPSALSNWRSRQKKGTLPPPDFIASYARNSQPLWYPETIKAFMDEQINNMKAAMKEEFDG